MPLDICNFNLLLKKATAVAETSNITFLASVNFLIFFIFKPFFVVVVKNTSMGLGTTQKTVNTSTNQTELRMLILLHNRKSTN